MIQFSPEIFFQKFEFRALLFWQLGGDTIGSDEIRPVEFYLKYAGKILNDLKLPKTVENCQKLSKTL